MAVKALNRALIALPIGTRRRVAYLRAHHRPLSLRNPTRYSEKLNWRMVHDRRELLVQACDKLAMKRYAADRVGVDRLHIPRTFWSGVDVDALAGVDLPARWVLKPNAGTGAVHFGSGPADPAGLRPLARRWLADEGLTRWGEWGYGQARRLLVVEERIGADLTDLSDWKFFVFDGSVQLVQVDSGRFTDHRRRLYTPRWEPLPNRCQLPLAEPIERPAELTDMLRIAAELGAEFDHVRIDLYLVDGAIWFGELTPYSGSGMVSFDPDDLDTTLGAAWTLPGHTHPRELRSYRQSQSRIRNDT